MAKLIDTKRASQIMMEKNVDILVGSGFVNYGYITGYFTHFGLDYPGPLYNGEPLIRFAGLPRERDVPPFLITYPVEEGDITVQGTWIEDKKYYGPKYNVPGRPSQETLKVEADPTQCLANALKERDLLGSRIGLDMQNVSFALMKEIERKMPHTKFVDAHDDFLALRIVKTPEEIRRLKGAVKGVERGHKVVMESLKEDLTGLELAAIVKRAVIDSETDRYLVHVCFGKEGTISGAPTKTRLRRGDLVSVDICSWYEYYAGDMFRVYSFGKPSKDVVDIHEALDGVNSKVIESIRPGMKASELYDIGAKTMGDAGLPMALEFAGHGVGLDLHEPPFLIPNDNTILQPNMILVIEIATRRFDLGHFCDEETVLITDDGYEVLSSIPRTLTIVE